ncbi:MAG: FtsQ-type POTRA domain-containing protein [Pyrinomonadaceae bacterium]|nr:FtsQ-type POTRA domain-containing protein [Pyrinomonadaceae bacterium]
MAKKRKPTTRPKGAAVRVRSGRKPASSRNSASFAGRALIPLALSGALLLCIGVLAAVFYQTAAGSPFFKVRNIEIRGNVRTSPEDIRRVVIAEAEKTGVWNSDIAAIKAKIEKFPFVKSAALSRELPAGIRVDITERVPAAIVRLKAGDHVVDTDGNILVAAKDEKNLPFTLLGWDETKSEKAQNDNLARLKLYTKMVDEWRQFDLVSRVKMVDLSNVREPAATIEDSGRAIAVFVAKDNLGKSLRSAIEAVAGKGEKVRSVDAAGIYPVIQYIEF